MKQFPSHAFLFLMLLIGGFSLGSLADETKFSEGKTAQVDLQTIISKEGRKKVLESLALRKQFVQKLREYRKSLGVSELDELTNPTESEKVQSRSATSKQVQEVVPTETIEYTSQQQNNVPTDQLQQNIPTADKQSEELEIARKRIAAILEAKNYYGQQWLQQENSIRNEWDPAYHPNEFYDHVGRAILEYAQNLRQLDYTGVPKDFMSVFYSYILKVEELAKVTINHPHLPSLKGAVGRGLLEFGFRILFSDNWTQEAIDTVANQVDQTVQMSEEQKVFEDQRAKVIEAVTEAEEQCIQLAVFKYGYALN